MEIEERKVVFKSLVGSYNYNLNTETSDKDYKIFLLPTFEDLYENKKLTKSIIGEKEDLDFHDIRECPSIWLKSNVSFLEVLFSKELLINEKLSVKSKLLITELYKMRNEIAKINLQYLYNSSVGMHRNKVKLLEKGTKNTRYLIEKYGYDTKQASNAFRILDFIKRFAYREFNDFESAIWYSKDDNSRELLLNIKNGYYSYSEYLQILNKLLQEVELVYKKIYICNEINEDTYNNIIEIIKELVKINIFE